jgi:hypothetical protein
MQLQPRESRLTPTNDALTVVAPTVRFKALAIFAAPRFSLAIVFKVRTSSLVHARLTTFFFGISVPIFGEPGFYHGAFS